MSDPYIRVAGPEDAPALLEIYTYYVRHTAITFEYDVPSPEEFTARVRSTLQKYPYLAAVENGVIVGYAYAGAFHPRAGAWQAAVPCAGGMSENAGRSEPERLRRRAGAGG